MNGLEAVWYRCPHCGELNETTVDSSAGLHQTYIEDCTVCCRPNILRIAISDAGDTSIDVEADE